MGKKFIIYGLIGWCAEVFWTGLGSLMKGDVLLSSFTSIWMFPIYGMAIFVEPLHNKIRGLPFIVRGSIYTIVFFSIEYTTGMFLKLILGASPWDYSGSPLSINGVIRLDFIPIWFSAGIIFEKIHDLLEGFSRVYFKN